ncbi:unnamed protein product [Calypogeia fissa]
MSRTIQNTVKKHIPFRGIVDDVKNRLPYVWDDWTRGFASGYRILVPTTYIFFASALPVIAFGEQLRRDTNGAVNAGQTLISTAICGILHSIFGGQPLLVVGVSEPTTLMYIFMYNFVKTKHSLGGQGLYLAWTAWVCVWSALLLLLLAIFGACSLINRFTRVAGELFGLLIAVLFVEQAIKGAVSEFRIPKQEDPSREEYQFPWRFGNGTFGLILLFGLVFTALSTRTARSWAFGTGWLRSLIAGYGVPLMVLLWTGISYAPSASVPTGIPRRIFSPNPWSSLATQHWKVVTEMQNVPVLYIFVALVPALMIAILYYFDHCVSAQLAQQQEFNLVKPPSYHYDLLLLSFMVLVCGLLGIPPSHGVIPQSPMHTRSLATLRHQLVRRKLISAAEETMQQDVTLGEVYGNLQDVFQQIEKLPNNLAQSKMELKELKPYMLSSSLGAISPEGAHLGEQNFRKDQQPHTFDPEVPLSRHQFDPNKVVDLLLPVRVQEQRLSNLLQSLMVAACVGAMPILRKIPTSVLWGYFALMAIESLPGNQFWQRITLLVTSPSRRYRILQSEHASFLETVPFRVIATFTIFQLVMLGACFGLTFAPVAGVLFPILIMALIPIRQFILPIFFSLKNLQQLDAAEYEEAPPRSFEEAVREAETQGLGRATNLQDGSSDAEEIINDVVTRSRGEFKRRSFQEGSPFLSSDDSVSSRPMHS